MKKVTEIAGAAGTKLRERTRSVKLRLLDISRIARAKGPLNHERLKQGYRKLLIRRAEWWGKRSASPMRYPPA
ncbi:hypothetical protein ACVWZZ_005907 [Bradyrhizobium sp. LM6.10]